MKQTMIRTAITLSALPACLSLLAGCIPDSGAAPAPSAPAPTPVAASTQDEFEPTRALILLEPDWRDWPVTQGRWTYRNGAYKADFIDKDDKPWGAITCSRNPRQISFAFRAVKMRTPPAAVPTTLITSFGERAVSSRYSEPEGNAYLDKRLTFSAPVNDTIWDEIIYSRGSFALRISDKMPISDEDGRRVPVSPEIARVVEDCRK